MAEDDNKTSENQENKESGFDPFSGDYMASVQEQMQKLAQNPEMLQKAIAPFMNMQKDYMKDPSAMGSLAESKTDTAELLDIVKRIRARIIRLERRLEESGVLKPLES